MHDIYIVPGYAAAGRQEECKDILIAVGSAGGGAVLAVAVISAAVTCTVCLVLKKRTNKNRGLSDQTGDYTSNGRLEQIHDVSVTDNNPAYNISTTTTSHELEVVYYDAVSQAGKVTAELPRDLDSNHDTLEENLAYESSAFQTIPGNQ